MRGRSSAARPGMALGRAPLSHLEQGCLHPPVPRVEGGVAERTAAEAAGSRSPEPQCSLLGVNIPRFTSEPSTGSRRLHPRFRRTLEHLRPTETSCKPSWLAVTAPIWEWGPLFALSRDIVLSRQRQAVHHQQISVSETWMRRTPAGCELRERELKTVGGLEHPVDDRLGMGRWLLSKSNLSLKAAALPWVVSFVETLVDNGGDPKKTFAGTL